MRSSVHLKRIIKTLLLILGIIPLLLLLLLALRKNNQHVTTTTASSEVYATNDQRSLRIFLPRGKLSSNFFNAICWLFQLLSTTSGLVPL